MMHITPVGVLSESPFESRRFYKSILGIERVAVLEDYANYRLLRLESPRIEVSSTTVTILDRPSKNFRRETHRLCLVCDNTETTLGKLMQEGIEAEEEHGYWHFTDINGLDWRLSQISRQTLANAA